MILMNICLKTPSPFLLFVWGLAWLKMVWVGRPPLQKRILMNKGTGRNSVASLLISAVGHILVSKTAKFAIGTAVFVVFNTLSIVSSHLKTVMPGRRSMSIVCLIIIPLLLRTDKVVKHFLDMRDLDMFI